ncbi:MAG TPA: murein L,D-transpeptidase, partial [Gemmatimonadetes bacterium]|nr:murein L,D-transpeptidase [Gemmatimonadota bacterium]
MRVLVLLSACLLVCESSVAWARPAGGTDVSELARPDAAMSAPLAPAIAQEPADEVVEAVRSRLAGPFKTNAAIDDVEAVRAYYAGARDPLWISGTEWSPRAVAIIDELRRADDWGLDASSFDIPVLAPASGDGIADTAALADAELKLSLAALNYARDARGGRIADPTGQLSAYIDRAPQLLPPVRVLSDLESASAPDRYLRGLNPQSAQFEALRRRYIAMRDGEDASLPKVPEDGGTIVAGAADPDVAIIRERLGVLAATQPDIYDDALVAAVEDFQRQHGLAADGVVGPRTRRAFNGGGGVSPQSLLANMEEWRWMPDDLGDTYVWVNVPEFVVRVVKDGRVIHTAPIVVGKTSTPTPIFSKDLKTIYFRPRWYIPDSIKANEIWPRLRRGGARGYQVLRNG